MVMGENRISMAERIAEKDDEIRSERELREAAERSAAAAKGNVTKLRNVPPPVFAPAAIGPSWRFKNTWRTNILISRAEAA